MKIDERKLEIAKARACMTSQDLIRAGIPKSTLCHACRQNLRPATVGKIARILGVDVTDLIEEG